MKSLRCAMLCLGLGLVVLGGSVPRACAETSSRQAIAQMLAKSKAAAIKQILLAFHSDDAVQRTNAIEAIQPLRDRARPLAEMGLSDKSAPVRFAALVTIGKLKLDSLAGQAKKLLDSKDGSLRAAAIYAASSCGLKVDVSQLAVLFASPNPEVRGNVAMLLGWMGNRSAVRMMQNLSRQPMPRASEARQAVVQLQVAEALLNLGDEKSLDALRAGAYSPFDEVRILAVQMLGKAQDHRMVPAFEQMIHQNPIQLRVAAAESLARMGDDSGAGEVAKASASASAAVRAQAAFALGVLRTRGSIEQLTGLLSDKKAVVRLAAAAAILKALQPAGGS